MSSSRLDYEATGPGLWSTPGPVPIAYLSLNVKAADSGVVNVWWSAPAQTASPPAPAPDRELGVNQVVSIDTGLAGGRTVYIADANGGNFDVAIAADTAPIVSSSTSPPVVADQLMTTLAVPQRGVNAAFRLPIPNGCKSIAVFATPPPAAGNQLKISGDQSGVVYQLGAISQIPQRAFVSRAIDTSVSITFNDEPTVGTPGGVTLWCIASMGDEMVDGVMTIANLTAAPVPTSEVFATPLSTLLVSVNTLAAGTSSVVLPGVTGKTIRVFGYSFSLMQQAATAGEYAAAVEDNVLPTAIAGLGLNMQTAAGMNAIPAAREIKRGIVCVTGAGVRVRSLAGTVGVVGVLEYTQT